MDDFEELMRIQRQMASSIVRESDTDRKLKVMDIFNSLVTNKKKRIQVEDLILEAQLEGIPESECIKLIDELTDLGYIQQSDGFLVRG